METRTVPVRLTGGDAAGLSVMVTLIYGDQNVTLLLHSRHRSGEWSYGISDEEQASGRTDFSYRVEYEWGYAWQATFQGTAEAGPLILPLPNARTGDSTFPFRCLRGPPQ